MITWECNKCGSLNDLDDAYCTQRGCAGDREESAPRDQPAPAEARCPKCGGDDYDHVRRDCRPAPPQAQGERELSAFVRDAQEISQASDANEREDDTIELVCAVFAAGRASRDAQVEGLRRELNEARASYCKAARERNDAVPERDALRAQVAELRKALGRICKAYDRTRGSLPWHEHSVTRLLRDAIEAARALAKGNDRG